MKNIKEKFISGREWPAHLQKCVTDGTWSNIVQLRARDTTCHSTTQAAGGNQTLHTLYQFIKPVILVLSQLDYDCGK